MPQFNYVGIKLGKKVTGAIVATINLMLVTNLKFKKYF